MTPLIVFAAIALPVLGFLLWIALQDAFIKISPGEIGLVITRGKPADHGVPPGTHFALRFGRVIEIYPAVELTYLTGEGEQVDKMGDHQLTFTSAPLNVTLGDRADATVHYTLRFAVTSEGLPVIHRRFGASGIRGIVRDESRRAIVETFNEADTGIADTSGPALNALETKIAERLTARLQACGFALSLFNLREISLGSIDEMIQRTLTAGEELSLARAEAAVRLARAEQEVELHGLLAPTLSDAALRYHQIEVWRELVNRWDGKTLVLTDRALPGGLAPMPVEPSPNAPEPPASGEPA